MHVLSHRAHISWCFFFLILAIHHSGAYHLNIKSSNVYLDSNNKPHVGGFRYIHSIHDDFTNFNAAALMYQTPEWLSNKRIGTETDVWGLGCIAFELCTLEHPYFELLTPGRNPQLVLMPAILNGNPPLTVEGKKPWISSYSQKLRDFVSSLLEREPRNRLDLETLILSIANKTCRDVPPSVIPLLRPIPASLLPAPPPPAPVTPPSPPVKRELSYATPSIHPPSFVDGNTLPHTPITIPVIVQVLPTEQNTQTLLSFHCPISVDDNFNTVLTNLNLPVIPRGYFLFAGCDSLSYDDTWRSCDDLSFRSSSLHALNPNATTLVVRPVIPAKLTITLGDDARARYDSSQLDPTMNTPVFYEAHYIEEVIQTMIEVCGLPKEDKTVHYQLEKDRIPLERSLTLYAYNILSTQTSFARLVLRQVK